MPVTSTHPIYDQYVAKWARCRAVFDGEDAVKAAKHTFLPRPGGLDDEEYAGYLKRALFYEAVGRTVAGFVGSIARKDPVIEAPEVLKPLLEDATTDGVSLDELTKSMCIETVLQGRSGVLVDYDEGLGRSYLSLWRTENIINWAADRIVLREVVYEPDPVDTFKIQSIDQYRELSVIDGAYTVTLWRLAKGESTTPGHEWVVYGNPITPTKRGKKFKEIPFFWLTPLGKTSRIENPPLLSLVNVCLSHYRNSADLEHGLHFTGLPTLYATGMVDPDKPMRIGSTAIVMLPDANAKLAYAEFTGQGLDGLSGEMKHKEEQMAALGATVFHDGPKGVEAAETARIRTSGETSLLVGVTTAVESVLEAALKCAADWMSASGDVSVTLNREFVDTTLDGPTLTGLVQAYQSGGLSLPQFLYNLQQGQLLAPDTDIEVETAAVQAADEKRAEKEAALKTTPK